MKFRWPLMWKKTHEKYFAKLHVDISRLELREAFLAKELAKSEAMIALIKNENVPKKKPKKEAKKRR